jgi:hypothetical protein
MKVGLPVHAEVARGAPRRAKALEAAGAKVEEMRSFLTRTARRHVPFFEARSYNDYSRCRRQAGEGAALHRRDGRPGARRTSAAAT